MEDLGAALRGAHPELEAVRREARSRSTWSAAPCATSCSAAPRADVDLVVEGDAAGARGAARRRAGVEHERFGTVKVEWTATSSTSPRRAAETYPHPGALPEVVVPAATSRRTSARRDFTINAMAIPLDGEARLIDPPGGRRDLESGLLRVLHERSFEDDPTRAIRAARYAARFGFELEPETERLLRGGGPGDRLRRPPAGRAGAAGRRTDRRRGARPARRLGADRPARRRGRAGAGG